MDVDYAVRRFPTEAGHFKLSNKGGACQVSEGLEDVPGKPWKPNPADDHQDA